ncbi:uncharacterized protein B0T23DRAFT_412142 [Neurospora hispaniola]|uniref:Uncharacterized protein n=1 Tax=Neurospora hispaniola TaxID=588809 RepID=A0AAJ0IB86_9PEZI|nr:hypothetical protein B0T23DRAFT_412142 [Neurospora hispaniola]
MCTFTRTAFRMCGHTEYRRAHCNSPINNRHELCKKTPIHLQSSKNGICTQCRTRDWEASMAKTSKVPDAEQQHGNKATHPGLAVGSRGEVSLHVSTSTTQNDNFQANTKKQNNATKSNSVGTELKGRARPLRQSTEHITPPPKKSAPKRQEPKIIRDKRTIIADYECKTSERREALHGPRALPGAHSTMKESPNLIDVTKPMHKDDEERVALHGPRDMPTTHHIIRENWKLMTVANPVRRGDRGRLRRRGLRPFPNPNSFPTANPAVNSLDARGQTACAPLVLQEVNKPTNRKVREAAGEQFLHRLQDAIPPLPMSYKPILTGRHPLHRPLPPIPDENFWITIERYSPAPDAPVGTYFGRETVYYGWQPARCDTVCSSFTE